jgi:hypothetical protein
MLDRRAVPEDVAVSELESEGLGEPDNVRTDVAEREAVTETVPETELDGLSVSDVDLVCDALLEREGDVVPVVVGVGVADRQSDEIADTDVDADALVDGVDESDEDALTESEPVTVGVGEDELAAELDAVTEPHADTDAERLGETEPVDEIEPEGDFESTSAVGDEKMDPEVVTEAQTVVEPEIDGDVEMESVRDSAFVSDDVVDIVRDVVGV